MASVYNPAAYAKWQARALEALRTAQAPEEGPLTGPLFVTARFMLRKARTSKLIFPTGLRSGDIDNHQKAIYDVITKAGRFWKDDCQIIMAAALKDFAPPDTPEHIRVTCHEIEGPSDLQGLYTKITEMLP